MDKYKLLTKSKQDLREILRYIARDNFPASERMRVKFTDAFKKLGENPRIGQKRSDLTPKPYRFWPVTANYLIIYNAEKQPIEILRIYSAARNSDDLV